MVASDVERCPVARPAVVAGAKERMAETYVVSWSAKQSCSFSRAAGRVETMESATRRKARPECVFEVSHGAGSGSGRRLTSVRAVNAGARGTGQAVPNAARRVNFASGLTWAALRIATASWRRGCPRALAGAQRACVQSNARALAQ